MTVETNEFRVERFSITTSQPFAAVVSRVEREIGHPDIGTFSQRMASTATLADLEAVVREAVGSAGLMEFARFDLGAVLRKEPGASARQRLRLLIGNPLIMKEMVKHAPDAGSYAPVTVLIDEREDGVHLSYDRMASFLAPYLDEKAFVVARDLDAKIEALLTQAASPQK